MKTFGTIIRIRASVRRAYGNYGITIVFITEYGELIRTYNIPKCESKKSKLYGFLKMFTQNPPFGLADKPTLFCSAIEKLLRNIECELVIIESGNCKYRYDILEINPILTVINKYSTTQDQETISNGEDSVR
jgi:hypothetical protein